MHFISSPLGHELTYNDVFMMPSRSSVPSRMDVDLTSNDGLSLGIPLVVSNMTAISGRRMAETIARRGGIAILPQDIPVDVLARTIKKVKSSPTAFETAVTVSPNDTIATALTLMPKRAHNAVVAVDQDGRPLGIMTKAEAQNVDRFCQVHQVMFPVRTTVSSQTGPQEVFEALEENHEHLAIAIDDDGRLIGVMTKKGALRSTIYRPALDADGRLKVGCAIGISGDVQRRALALLEAGADVIVLDTAHGHQDRMIDALPKALEARDAFELVTETRVPIVAGNVVTRGAVIDLIEAGADIVKVGIGPGAMCTTRMQTGVGRPQFSAVVECAAAAKDFGKSIWADGGIRYPRDVSLALAAGAGSVMIGSWFAGTHESTGEMLQDSEGRYYKESFGMASKRAVRNRTREKTAFERARAAIFEEGISSSKMYLDVERPGVEDLVDFITSGVRSSCTYAGASDLRELAEYAVVGAQSPSGYDEGRPLNTSWR